MRYQFWFRSDCGASTIIKKLGNKESLFSKELEKNSEIKITIHAKNTTLLNLNQANSMIKLLEMLDDIDDVQNVFSNAEFPDEILEQI